MTGEGTLDHDFNELSQHDLKSGELQVGLPAALVILLLVFGAVVAGLVPLLMAIVSIVVALGLCALLAEAFTLSVFFVNMLTGMGLALGIDYSLFVVSRYREERADGRAELDAIAAAGATASRAVLFSGSVFVIALSGMLLVPSNVMKSLAVAAIAVGIVSVHRRADAPAGAARPARRPGERAPRALDRAQHRRRARRGASGAPSCAGSCAGRWSACSRSARSCSPRPCRRSA